MMMVPHVGQLDRAGIRGRKFASAAARRSASLARVMSSTMSASRDVQLRILEAILFDKMSPSVASLGVGRNAARRQAIMRALHSAAQQECPVMPKGEQRGNREAKKPKKDKPKTNASAPSLKGATSPAKK
jgi:hypothetical protein